jgi:hypothetical protein
MDPVKIANRHRPAAGRGRQLLKMANDMHAGQARSETTSADGGGPGKLAIIELPPRAVNDRSTQQAHSAYRRYSPAIATNAIAIGRAARYTEHAITYRREAKRINSQ